MNNGSALLLQANLVHMLTSAKGRTGSGSRHSPHSTKPDNMKDAKYEYALWTHLVHSFNSARGRAESGSRHSPSTKPNHFCFEGFFWLVSRRSDPVVSPGPLIQ